MAAANEKATATISSKTSLGNGKYLYLGTLAFGSEYKTGGNDLATASGERYSMPTTVEYLGVQGAYSFELSSGKVKVYWPEKEKVKMLELAAKTDLSTTLAAAPFFCIGS